MSTVESDLDVPGGAAQPAPGDTEVTTARIARVGDLGVRRLLPLRQRRSVGAWCFVDHYGPASVRFGQVTGYRGAPLAAPPLDPARLARKAR
jgi:hypothetical protein